MTDASHQRKAEIALKPGGTQPGGHRTKSIVIDDDGQAWDIRDHSLHLRLGARPDGSFDIAGFLADSAGWVALSIRGSRLRARLNPLIAAPGAVATLRRIMASFPEASVTLAAMGAVTLLGKGAAAQALLSERLVVHPQRVGPRFASDRLSLNHLFREGRKPLLGTLSKGRGMAHRQTLDRESAIRLAAADPSGRSSLNRAVPAAGGTWRWTTEYVAPSISFFDREDRDRLLGSDIRNSPDSDYGRWCAATYQRVLEGGEPVLDRVRALVHRRVGPPVDTSYYRLIQPFRAEGGGWRILATTEALSLRLVA